MSETRGMLIGFDIGREEARVSVFDRREKKAVQVSVRAGSKVCAFPARLTWMPEKDEWHTGFEADYFAREKGGKSAGDLLTAAVSGVRMGEKFIEGWKVIQLFVSGSLKYIVPGDLEKSVAGICITTEKLTPALVRAFRRALSEMGFDAGHGFIKSYEESFYYYAYAQRPDVWNRCVGLISFAGSSVEMRYIKEMKSAKTLVMQVKKLGETTLPENDDAKDARFAEVLDTWMRDRAFSGIFIVGNGFGDWSKKSLQRLMRGKCHVFAGDSLYADGAAWAVFEKLEGPNIRGRIYLGPDMLRASCGMDVIDRGKQVWYPMLAAGENWYDRTASVDFILDGRQDVTVSVLDAVSGRRWNKTMKLDGLPKRPDRTTRIHLTAEAHSPERIVITAKDLGFGELFPATYATWEMEVSL